MAIYSQTVLADSPNLYLRFEETAGASCADSSGNSLTGTANGTFTRNVSMPFTGLNIGVSWAINAANNVSIPDNALLHASKPVSYEAWFNPSSLPAFGAIMSQGNTGGAGFEGWKIGINNTGVLSASLANTGTIAISTGAGTISAGTLYHVVFTKDSSNNNVIYINGVSVASNNNATAPSGNSTQPFVVGGSNDGGSILFQLGGTFDEVAVYASALSAARVAAHYAARNTTGGGGPAANTVPPGQLVSALAHERNSARKQDETPGKPERISDYYKHRRR